MAEQMPSASEVYRMLLDQTGRVGASELADQINRVVGRGVVVLSQPKSGTKVKVKEERIFRAATEEESLALAVELLLAATEVPLMLEKVRETTGATAIKWLPDQSGTQTVEVSTDTIANVDAQTLRELRTNLHKISELLAELKLTVPEVA